MWLYIFTAAGALVGFAGFLFAHAAYEGDRMAAEEKDRRETARDVDLRDTRIQLSVTHQELAKTHRELSKARAQTEAAEDRRKRQLRKLAEATDQVDGAINEGEGLRISLLGFQKEDPDFDSLFDQKYAGGIEKWREKTELMLNAAVPTLKLGNNFKAVDGIYTGRKSDYGLSRVMNCVSELRAIKRALPGYVERVID
jgi:hypothetical protein